MTYEQTETRDLHNSILFDKHLVTKLGDARESVDKVTEHLWKEFKGEEARLAKSRYKRKETLKQIVINLALCDALNDKWLALPLNRNEYSRVYRLGLLFMTYESVKWVTDHLATGDYVIREGGYDGVMTRFKATEKLKDLYRYSPRRDEFEPDMSNLPTVILRRKKEGTKNQREIIEITDKRKITRSYKILKAYNTLLIRSRVQYTEPQEGNIIPALKKDLRQDTLSNYLDGFALNCQQDNSLTIPINNLVIRVYARGRQTLDMGARLYSKGFCNTPPFQILKQEQRKTITIDNQPTVELDYSGLHLRMLYAEKGIQYNQDPYSCICEDANARDFLKTLLLIAINAETREKVTGAIHKQATDARKKIEDDSKNQERHKQFLQGYNMFRNEIPELFEELKITHQPIADSFGSDIGVILQKRDSDMIMDILKHFTDRGILVLPVHDSVIIARQHETELRHVMHDTYQKHNNGFTCPIHRK
jgi:hypothetical protein